MGVFQRLRGEWTPKKQMQVPLDDASWDNLDSQRKSALAAYLNSKGVLNKQDQNVFNKLSEDFYFSFLLVDAMRVTLATNYNKQRNSRGSFIPGFRENDLIEKTLKGNMELSASLRSLSGKDGVVLNEGIIRGLRSALELLELQSHNSAISSRSDVTNNIDPANFMQGLYIKYLVEQLPVITASLELLEESVPSEMSSTHIGLTEKYTNILRRLDSDSIKDFVVSNLLNSKINSPIRESLFKFIVENIDARTRANLLTQLMMRLRSQSEIRDKDQFMNTLLLVSQLSSKTSEYYVNSSLVNSFHSNLLTRFLEFQPSLSLQEQSIIVAAISNCSFVIYDKPIIASERLGKILESLDGVEASSDLKDAALISLFKTFAYKVSTDELVRATLNHLSSDFEGSIVPIIENLSLGGRIWLIDVLEFYSILNFDEEYLMRATKLELTLSSWHEEKLQNFFLKLEKVDLSAVVKTRLLIALLGSDGFPRNDFAFNRLVEKSDIGKIVLSMLLDVDVLEALLNKPTQYVRSDIGEFPDSSHFELSWLNEYLKIVMSQNLDLVFDFLNLEIINNKTATPESKTDSRPLNWAMWLAIQAVEDVATHELARAVERHFSLPVVENTFLVKLLANEIHPGFASEKLIKMLKSSNQGNGGLGNLQIIKTHLVEDLADNVTGRKIRIETMKVIMQAALVCPEVVVKGDVSIYLADDITAEVLNLNVNIDEINDLIKLASEAVHENPLGSQTMGQNLLLTLADRSERVLGQVAAYINRDDKTIHDGSFATQVNLLFEQKLKKSGLKPSVSRDVRKAMGELASNVQVAAQVRRSKVSDTSTSMSRL